jgi:phosphate-selective porin OprO and OprP
MTWAVGGYMQQDNSSGTSFQDYNNVNIAARVTGLPWYEDDGCQLLHLGFGFRHLFRSDTLKPDNATLEFLSKPEWDLGQNTVDTKLIPAQGANMINPEAAVVYGPFSVQGEYFRSFVDKAVDTKTMAVSNPEFDGYYVFASYFLTGEHRNYNRNGGVFDRPKLCNNFDPSKGTWGAWELSGRYSNIDLNDRLITGGRESDWTGGLVWYLNPNVRWLFDYVHAHVDHGTAILGGNANIVDTRFQVVW